MKRTPLKADPAKAMAWRRRSKPINPQSEKRKKEQRELDKVNKALRGTPCVVKWDERCTGIAEQGDHILSRARGGPLADPKNVRGACQHCHRMLTERPAEAERRGLTLHAWERWPRCAACDTPHDPEKACMPGLGERVLGGKQ